MGVGADPYHHLLRDVSSVVNIMETTTIIQLPPHLHYYLKVYHAVDLTQKAEKGKKFEAKVSRSNRIAHHLLTIVQLSTNSQKEMTAVRGPGEDAPHARSRPFATTVPVAVWTSMAVLLSESTHRRACPGYCWYTPRHKYGGQWEEQRKEEESRSPHP